MGKVKTDTVKRTARNLYTRYPDYFNTDFPGNKEKLKNVLLTPSKKVRNGVAGYLTRLGRIKTRESHNEEEGNVDSEEEME